VGSRDNKSIADVGKRHLPFGANGAFGRRRATEGGRRRNPITLTRRGGKTCEKGVPAVWCVAIKLDLCSLPHRRGEVEPTEGILSSEGSVALTGAGLERFWLGSKPESRFRS
jgi:hypothetical protein